MIKRDKLPKIIKEVGFDFDWDNSKVWKLEVPIEEINIKELEWHFQIPFWNSKEGYYDLKPIEVINFPKKYKEEFERAMNSDISYPIDIMINKGKLLILDGLHRLVKLKLLGHNKIKVRKIPITKIPKITR